MATVKLDPAKGIQIPNLTTTERNAISSPETGAIIWNTTTSEINQYNGSAWEITYTDTSVAGITSSADATAITITSTEKVGIGTASPNRLLTVEGHGNEPDISLVQLDNTNNNFNELRFLSVGSDDSTRRVGASVKGIYTTHSATSPTTDLSFSTRNSSDSLAERMRIKDNGNIGIAENTPIRKFHIVGPSGNGSTMLLHMDADTAGGECGIEFKADSTNDDRRIKAAIKYRRDNPGTRGTGNLHFCVNGDNNDVNVSTSHSRMMLNTDGLHFNGDTAAANALDDYEEGESTITISPASGSITLRSTHNKCLYTKVGRLVSFNIHIRVLSVSSPSGGVNINGLPFTCGSDEKFRASASVAPVYNFSSPSGSMALAWVGNNSTSMNFAFYNGSTQTLSSAGYFQGDTEAYITGSYMTA